MVKTSMPHIEEFLASVAAVDGFESVSDAKVENIGVPDRMVVIEEADNVVGVGLIARHDHSDGSDHWAVETALEPGLRFVEFESQLLQMAVGLVPHSGEVSVWSRRPSLDSALRQAGFSDQRELAFLTVDLPLEKRGPLLGTRAFRPADTQQLLSVNAAAYAEHREAATLDSDAFNELMTQDGFSVEGLRIASADEGIAGFCWTRVHRNGEGEIYRIAVAPQHQGRGVGRLLLTEGFAYLDSQPTVERGSLWVDTSDKAAMSLYASVGMVVSGVNREFLKDS